VATQKKAKQGQTQDSIRSYLQAIGRIPLLTGDQEIFLARQIQDGIAIAHCLQELYELDKAPSLIDCLTFDLEAEDKIILRLAKRAQDKMVQANLRLVVSIAKKYKTTSDVELLDLIQDGTLGLIRATEKFDPAKGYKLSTYAHWWIKQGITRTRGNQGRVIRLPVHVCEKIVKIKKELRLFFIANERSPTPLELSKLVGISLQTFLMICQSTRATFSLDVQISQNDRRPGVSVLDMQESEAISPIDAAILLEQKQMAEQYLGLLDARSQQVLELRFGIIGSRDHTLAEIGEYLGVSRERARQIQSSAMRKLKVIASRDAIGLAEYLEA